MADGMKNFVESGTDARYVKFGSCCSVCSKKLGFFETGFWSTNANWVNDGPLCKECAEKVRDYLQNKSRWMSKKALSSRPWKNYDEYNFVTMTVEEVKELFALKAESETEKLSQHSADTTSLFRVKDVFQIETKPTEVGIVRARKLNGRMTVFGITDTGEFKKGDKVKIENAADSTVTEAEVLEAYVYDCEDNTIYVELRANMGKQRVPKDKKGWLVLSIESGINPDDIITK
ncbi:MAG: hypothetical protein E7566_00990 [Ruminococcaceae bacterium]|nr:hypothetical protein [Oscillospiraceae bacterium]